LKYPSQTATIYVIGPRGLGKIIGGIERHCEEIYARIAHSSSGRLRIIACVIRHHDTNGSAYKEIELNHIKTSKIRGLEKLIYSFKAVSSAIINRADIIHFQGLNSVLALPLAKIFGVKTVVTIHSRDYNYPKWSFLEKKIIKLAEYCSNLADQIITVSEYDYQLFKDKTANLNYIANGVSLTGASTNSSVINRLNLESKGYIFTACRFTEEKSLLELIEAYSMIDMTNYKLVIAGDGVSQYAKKVKELASHDPNIILVGPIFGKDLVSFYQHAQLFVLSSCHEVSPLSLLEAMTVKTDVLSSDLPVIANLGLASKNLFTVNSVADLKEKIEGLLIEPSSSAEIEKRYLYVCDNHNWDRSAKQTYDIYSGLLAPL
jgi:starch synthase